MNYMLIIIECEISPLLYECCLYVGNVQINRISCWCELTFSCVLLGSLWYVTGWEYLLCFPLLRIIFELCCRTFWIEIFIWIVYVEAVVPTLLNNELNFPLRCFVKVVLINSNFTLFMLQCRVAFRLTLNTLN